MKVIITDTGALSALSPPGVTAYLLARGWTVVESDAAFAVFERPSDGDRVGLDVPLRPSAGDYARRVAKLLHNLELLEDRSQLDSTTTSTPVHQWQTTSAKPPGVATGGS